MIYNTMNAKQPAHVTQISFTTTKNPSKYNITIMTKCVLQLSRRNTRDGSKTSTFTQECRKPSRLHGSSGNFTVGKTQFFSVYRFKISNADNEIN